MITDEIMNLTNTKIFKQLDKGGEYLLCTSYSQIDTYLQCPNKWKLTYLLGYRKPEESEALSLGSSIHETLEYYFNSRKDGKELTIAETLDGFEDKIREHNVPWTSDKTKEQAMNQHYNTLTGLASGDSKLAHFMYDKEVVACEKDFRLHFHLPFDICFAGEIISDIYIIGAIDFIVKDHNGNLYVIDFKSGKKPFNGTKLKHNLQLPIYSLVVLNMYGRLPVSTQYYFTRLDLFQSVEKLAANENSARKEYYKSGKKQGQLKYKQRTVHDVETELINIFKDQYTNTEYKPKPTPLCSWCNFGKYYGDGKCNYAMHYHRKDKKENKMRNAILIK